MLNRSFVRILIPGEGGLTLIYFSNFLVVDTMLKEICFENCSTSHFWINSSDLNNFAMSFLNHENELTYKSRDFSTLEFMGEISQLKKS